ncbi:unnamed protein product [Diabrotica balteata]|uniref:Uncharacterized protein n=1 Tax=Diabrotica balteata TaxID=107213 RepID=A0A9P0GZT7_DIABA|nr:unnamed protein product [Diabrotica balteata]
MPVLDHTAVLKKKKLNVARYRNTKTNIDLKSGYLCILYSIVRLIWGNVYVFIRYLRARKSCWVYNTQLPS